MNDIGGYQPEDVLDTSNPPKGNTEKKRCPYCKKTTIFYEKRPEKGAVMIYVCFYCEAAMNGL